MFPTRLKQEGVEYFWQILVYLQAAGYLDGLITVSGRAMPIIPLSSDFGIRVLLYNSHGDVEISILTEQYHLGYQKIVARGNAND